MLLSNSIEIKRVDDEHALNEALKIREIVFILGQGVPRSIEVDEFEKTATHFLLKIGNKPVATGRVRLKKPYGKLERIAVLPEFRGKGLGQAITEHMNEFVKKEYPLYLPAMHAQEHALGFYEQMGWIAVGKPFSEAGISHCVMIHPLRDYSAAKNLLLWSDSSAPEEIQTAVRKALEIDTTEPSDQETIRPFT